MLKKSLHFLKRFILFCLSLFLLFSLLSCTVHRENYLSFLDSPAQYDSSLIINGEKAATFILTAEGRDGDGKEVLRLRFTSPEALCGAEILCVGDERTLTYNGISLEGYTIPRVWSEISNLFSPKGEVSDVKVKDGKSFITVTDNENGRVAVYVLTKDGALSRIESDITVEIHSIRRYEKGGKE